jgi:hypothetical protein
MLPGRNDPSSRQPRHSRCTQELRRPTPGPALMLYQSLSSAERIVVDVVEAKACSGQTLANEFGNDPSVPLPAALHPALIEHAPPRPAASPAATTSESDSR